MNDHQYTDKPRRLARLTLQALTPAVLAVIMAALSVESARDGKKTGSPCIPASRSNVARNSRFAATPPLTKRVCTSYARAAASVFATRSLTIVRWKEATRSSVCRSILNRSRLDIETGCGCRR